MAGDSLHEGMEIMVRCRIGKVYEPPGLVALSIAPSCPLVLAQRNEIEWWPLEEAPCRKRG